MAEYFLDMFTDPHGKLQNFALRAVPDNAERQRQLTAWISDREGLGWRKAVNNLCNAG
jgi:hypothetical protein